MKYRRDSVCGIFYLEWATRQPRLVDLTDGVALFAGTRMRPVDASDIRSLTQPFPPSPARNRLFLDGYRSVGCIEPEELHLLPKFFPARWLWCRADPMRRKIPREKAVDFILDGVWRTIEQIRQAGASYTKLV